MIYTNVDEAYLDLVSHVFENGVLETNRTGIETLTTFGYSYKLQLERNTIPLLHTKSMKGAVWNSLIEEIAWYLQGVSHIKDFKHKSKIWNAWADENDNLETAYGRFWRSFPTSPEGERCEGEVWKDSSVDQVKNILENLLQYKQNGSRSRRMVLTAWHPANATISKLPPCHLMAIFSVVGGKLNVHLTQRSGDIGLGIPFNIACYSLLCQLFARLVGLDVGCLSHTIVDAHIYCGKSEDDPFSHTRALREHLSRKATSYPAHPSLVWGSNISEKDNLTDIMREIDTFQASWVEVKDYNPLGPIKMKVAP